MLLMEDGKQKDGWPVRISFRQKCSCSLKPEDFPKPGFKTIQVPDMTEPYPEAILDITYTCSKCGTPWGSNQVETAKSFLERLKAGTSEEAGGK